jgi:hypothetical protein
MRPKNLAAVGLDLPAVCRVEMLDRVKAGHRRLKGDRLAYHLASLEYDDLADAYSAWEVGIEARVLLRLPR